MLCRDYDRFHSHRSVIFVAKGHLALGIRTQPWQLAGLSHLSLALHESMRAHDWCWHKLIGLVARITEHKSLVASALFEVYAFSFIAVMLAVEWLVLQPWERRVRRWRD